MEKFPSHLEQVAASALLRLSCKALNSASNSMSIMERKEEEKTEFERELQKNFEALELSSLKSCADDDMTPCDSSLNMDNSVRAHRLKLMNAAATRCHEIKLKVARRARTKVIYQSTRHRKPELPIRGNPNANPDPKKVAESDDMTTTATMTTPEGSCLSSGGSSGISSAGSGLNRRMRKTEGGIVAGGKRKVRGVEGGEMMKRRGMGSTQIRRRAEAIIRLLSRGGCASEVRIRQVLGDSPDTSKALRMLLKTEEVKRTGLGGRTDPFIYKIAA